jgi:hypothetical protein
MATSIVIVSQDQARELLATLTPVQGGAQVAPGSTTDRTIVTLPAGALAYLREPCGHGEPVRLDGDRLWIHGQSFPVADGSIFDRPRTGAEIQALIASYATEDTMATTSFTATVTIDGTTIATEVFDEAIEAWRWLRSHRDEQDNAADMEYTPTARRIHLVVQTLQAVGELDGTGTVYGEKPGAAVAGPADCSGDGVACRYRVKLAQPR